VSDPLLRRRIRLGPQHQPTGKTRHYHGNTLLPAPYELRIVKYLDSNDPGCYLFHCDASGTEFTDTYHETVEDAMSQAEWEFGVKQDEWEIIADI
jgi:hypothetical protein